MRILIAVDATPIISSLIGGLSRSILFEGKFKFITTSFTIDEVKKYVPTISEKSGVSETKIMEAISLLPLEVFDRGHYDNSIGKSRELVGEIDPKDIDILALSLKENCFLWSEDKHFRNLENVNLLRTKDLI